MDSDLELAAVIASAAEIDHQSDDDIGVVLDAVPASPLASQSLAGESDEEMGLVLNLVADSGRRLERYERRGHLLMRMLRHRKQLIGQVRIGRIAPHVLDRIAVHNADYANTASDVIDLSQRRPLKVKGPGKYRVWIPAAVQRCSWGFRPRQKILKRPRRVRLRGKQPQFVSPTVPSGRTVAYFMRCSHTHVQKHVMLWQSCICDCWLQLWKRRCRLRWMCWFCKYP